MFPFVGFFGLIPVVTFFYIPLQGGSAFAKNVATLEGSRALCLAQGLACCLKQRPLQRRSVI